jgi:hypothetical protein
VSRFDPEKVASRVVFQPEPRSKGALGGSGVGEGFGEETGGAGVRELDAVGECAAAGEPVAAGEPAAVDDPAVDDPALGDPLAGDPVTAEDRAPSGEFTATGGRASAAIFAAADEWPAAGVPAPPGEAEPAGTDPSGDRAMTGAGPAEVAGGSAFPHPAKPSALTSTATASPAACPLPLSTDRILAD